MKFSDLQGGWDEVFPCDFLLQTCSFGICGLLVVYILKAVQTHEKL